MTVSSREPITAFLPCRRGSERILRKNIRPFAGFDYGLVEIKLNQLIDCPVIDQVVLSTDDDEIIAFAENLPARKLTIHHRDPDLATSQTSTDQLVGHAASLIECGHILWTHVTSPFFGVDQYAEAVHRYLRALEKGYDSLMTTTELKGFIWSDDGPVNYDRAFEKWPRTQTLKPMHEINSAVFLADVEIYRRMDDRIGSRPFLYAVDPIRAIDIDWPRDFNFAQALVDAGVATP